jgi:hypothetical protein
LEVINNVKKGEEMMRKSLVMLLGSSAVFVVVLSLFGASGIKQDGSGQIKELPMAPAQPAMKEIGANLPVLPPVPEPKPVIIEPEPEIMEDAGFPGKDPSLDDMLGGAKEFPEVSGTPTGAVVPVVAVPTIAAPAMPVPAVVPVPAQPEVKPQVAPVPLITPALMPALKGKLDALAKELAETITESVIQDMRDRVHKKVTKEIEDLIAKVMQESIK